MANLLFQGFICTGVQKSTLDIDKKESITFHICEIMFPRVAKMIILAIFTLTFLATLRHFWFMGAKHQCQNEVLIPKGTFINQVDNIKYVMQGRF